MRRVQSGVSSSGWHSPCGIITWGHTQFPVPSFIPGHDPRDTGMGLGCPERCLGPCCCHPAHAGLPAILLPARPAPPQPGTSQGSSTFPALGFPPLEASVAPAVGSPLPARSGVRGLGTTAAGTCSRRYRERGENTTAMLPRSSCCRWDVGAVSPRVPARLSLDASSVFAEPSPSSLLRQLPALPPARPWRKLGKKRFHSAQLRQPGSDHVRHSARPGLLGRARLQQEALGEGRAGMWGGTREPHPRPPGSPFPRQQR